MQFVNNHKRYVHFCTKLDELLKVKAHFSWVIADVYVNIQEKGLQHYFAKRSRNSAHA
jgi:hypothetical protein